MHNPTAADLTNLISSRDIGFVVRTYGGAEGLVKELGSNLQTGLSNSSASLHRKEYGNNAMPIRKPVNYFCTLAMGLKDPVIIVLILISILLITFGLMPQYTYDVYAWVNGIITLFMLLLLLFINAFVAHNKAKILWKAAENSNKHTVTLVRDGMIITAQAEEIVVGDIVCLKTGSFVPADGLLLTGNRVQMAMDLSSVTNGSLSATPIDISHNPFLNAGSYIIDADGEARMVVLAVGSNTILGNTRMHKGYAASATNLQKRLEKLYLWTTIVALLGSVFVFIAMTIQLFKSSNANDNRQLTVVVYHISIALIIFIVAAPEALQMSLGLALGYSMKKMTSEGINIKSYAAIESLACCNCIVFPMDMISSNKEDLLIARNAKIQVYFATSTAHDVTLAQASDLLDQDLQNIANCVMRGSELFALSQEEINNRLTRISVVSEITPIDFYHLICSLRGPNTTVACVGFENKHAVGLRAADIGITAANDITDLCRDSSDIVLDHIKFPEILRAIQWGYGIVHNTRKFIQFQYAAGISVVMLTFFAAAIFNNIIFTAAQLLNINLIIDALAAVAFGGDPPIREKQVRRLKKDTKIFNPSMIRNIIVYVLYASLIGILGMIPGTADSLFGTPDRLSGPDSSRDEFADILAHNFRMTCIYNFIILSFLFNMFWTRTTYREINIFIQLKEALNFWIIFGVIIGTHLIVMLIPGVTFIFGTFSCLGTKCLLGDINGSIPRPFVYFSIGWQGWLVTILLACLILPINLLFRLLPVAPEFQGKSCNKRQIA